MLISTDIIFFVYYNYKNIKVPLFQYFITIFHYIGYSFNDCIEKYLVDNNYGINQNIAPKSKQYV